MSYSWNDNSQIGINEQISLPTFKLKEYLVRPECTRTFSTGNFSCFEGYLLLTRRISYYLIHIFFPSTLCVIVSWTAFWIKEQFASIILDFTSELQTEQCTGSTTGSSLKTQKSLIRHQLV